MIALKDIKIISFLVIIIGLLSINPAYAVDVNSDSMRYYFHKTYRYYKNDSTKQALIAIENAFKYGDPKIDKLRLGKLYSIQGYIYLSQGASARALRSFSNAKVVGIELDDVDLIIAGYHGLGRTYIVLEELDKAKENLKKGLGFAIENGYKGAEAVLYNAIGILEVSQENNRAALNNFYNFLRLSIEKKDTLSIVYAYVNLGESYLKIDIFDSAYYFINKANDLNGFTKDAQASASIYGNYGILAFKENNYDKSIELINRSLKIAYDNNFSEFIIDNYYSLLDDYKALQNIEKASYIFKKLDNYKDSIHKINDEKKYAAINSLNALREKEAQVIILEQKFRNRTLILILSVALSLVFIVLLIILYRIYYADKSKHKSEKKNLSEIIDEKNRELVTRIISEKQHTNLVDLINKSIYDISERKSIDGVKTDLLLLKKSITVKEQITNNWDSFKIQFQKVHPNFFNSLLEKEPNLTSNELRMCAYIRMNMSTKEIANLLNISDRSIQTSRYRLKKKLNLGPDVDLIPYIQAI